VSQFLDFHRARVQSPASARIQRLQSRKAILAIGLLLFRGMRRQDMVSIGKQHCRSSQPGILGDWIRYLPKKRGHRSREISQKPLLPILKAIINDSADVLGGMTFPRHGARQAVQRGGCW
jgi:hypothetical protein